MRRQGTRPPPNPTGAPLPPAERELTDSQAHEAYERGDGAEAKQLSNESKSHAAKMVQYNKQASEYIFRANNSTEKVSDNEIDLHGQFVEEAKEILQARIRDAQARNQTYLRVIVGKGNHSVNHVQKLKPMVVELCEELRLGFNTEVENQGRIDVNLQGHEIPHIPLPPASYSGGGYGGGAHHGGQQQQHQQQQHHGQANHGQQHPRPPAQTGQPQEQQEQQEEDSGEKLKKKIISKLTSKLGDCCVVM